jgi:hypothetical protein
VSARSGRAGRAQRGVYEPGTAGQTDEFEPLSRNPPQSYLTRIADSTSSEGSPLVQKNQSSHSTPSSRPSIRSLAVPHEPAGGTITGSPGRPVRRRRDVEVVGRL